jgi:hypothetical protein
VGGRVDNVDIVIGLIGDVDHGAVGANPNAFRPASNRGVGNPGFGLGI